MKFSRTKVARKTSKIQKGTSPFSIVGVGASAGGLEAFTRLLRNLPTDTGMTFVLVQHLDPDHSSALPQLLSKATSLPVCDATNDLPVAADHVYVIPPNTNLSIEGAVLKLRPRARTSGPHRSIDTFFESLALNWRERAIGVILSGSSSDGTLGLEAIKAEGGITFAQDESAKFDSMPRSAISAGCVDFVLSPEQIAKEISRIANHPLLGLHGLADAVHSEEDDREKLHPLSGKAASGRPPAGEDAGFGGVLRLLRNHSNVDFSLYKPGTIQRRISRRMVLNKFDTLRAYADFLRGNTVELEALYSDVLIGVTSFFRNPETFDLLKRQVFPKIISERRDQPVRFWVLGCSTGQEAYSLAIAFAEVCAPISRAPKLQIFATDLNEDLLKTARTGLYTKSMVQDVSPQRLQRFFVEQDGGYRINKPLREAVVFARQNILNDPAFSRMDLISCRNVLIYIDTGSQKKIMRTFHYALRPNGFLLLGAAEGIGGFNELFKPLDKRSRIFVRKSVTTPPLHLRLQHYPADKKATVPRPPSAPEGFPLESQAQREADRVTRNRYAPPGVLVNAEFNVLEFRGETSPFLKPPRGGVTFNILKMAREGLLLPLRAALNQARKRGKAVRTENLRVNQYGQSRTATLEVVPLLTLKEPCYLILFEQTAPGPNRSAVSPAKAKGKPLWVAPEPAAAPLIPPSARRNLELEHELAETRDYLQSVQEQSEAAHEELQASNEEAISANEELQSINEELETSKEELESANEELVTLNEETASRNAELGRLNSDLINLQASTHLAIVLVGCDLTIRRFSPQAEKQFNLLASDIGRPLGNIRHNLDVPDLEAFIAEVISTLREREREVCDREGRWFSLRVRPYRTLDNQIDGAVVVLVDIDTLKRGELAIASSYAYAQNIVETIREPLLVLDNSLRVESANRSFYRSFGVSEEDTVGRFIYHLGNGEWDVPRLRKLLEKILPQDTFMEDFEVSQEFEKLGPRVMLLNARRIEDPIRKSHYILLAIEDITERKYTHALLEKEVQERTARLKESVAELEQFSHTITHDMRTPLQAVLGFGDLLSKELGELPPRAADYHKRIMEGARSMDALIREALQNSIRKSRSAAGDEKREA